MKVDLDLPMGRVKIRSGRVCLLLGLTVLLFMALASK